MATTRVTKVINGIVVEIPNLEKTGRLCAAMIERLGRRRSDGQEQNDSPVPVPGKLRREEEVIGDDTE
jgi:hypothetical protein